MPQLTKPIYKAFGEASATPRNSNLYYTLATDFVGVTLPLGFASFVNDAGVTATELYDTAGNPNLALNTFISGVLQEKSLVNAYSTSTVTLAFSSTVTIYATEVVQLSYMGSNVATTITVV